MDTAQCIHIIKVNLIHDVHLAIDLSYVDKIISLPRLERVPNAPFHVVGLLNYGDRVITVIDLALLFKLQRRKTYSLNTPIVICKKETQSIGLLVDEVVEIDKAAHEESTNFAKDNPYIKSSFSTSSGIHLLLNVDTVFEKIGELVHD